VHYCSENNPEKSQISSGLFWFFKKAKHVKKIQIFTIWLQKIKLATGHYGTPCAVADPGCGSLGQLSPQTSAVPP